MGCRRALRERMAVRASRGEREGSCGGCGGQTLGGKKGAPEVLPPLCCLCVKAWLGSLRF